MDDYNINDFDTDDVPPFQLEYTFAHLNEAMASGSWGAKETKWLDDNVPMFETGIYAFKANQWYDLACALASKQGRFDVWFACCTDIQFEYPAELPIPTKLADASKVRDLVTSWFYSHQNKNILPKWDEASQTLSGVSHPGRIKPEHVYAVLNAFATPELVAEVHRGVSLNQNLGLSEYAKAFKDSSDTWRFTSWLLSDTVLGKTTPVEVFDIPDLGMPNI